MRNRVVLPTPLRPMMATFSPFATCNTRPENRCFVPMVFSSMVAVSSITEVSIPDRGGTGAHYVSGRLAGRRQGGPQGLVPERPAVSESAPGWSDFFEAAREFLA